MYDTRPVGAIQEFNLFMFIISSIYADVSGPITISTQIERTPGHVFRNMQYIITP